MTKSEKIIEKLVDDGLFTSAAPVAICEICQRELPVAADVGAWGPDTIMQTIDPIASDLYNLSDADAQVVICGRDYAIRHDDL